MRGSMDVKSCSMLLFRITSAMTLQQNGSNRISETEEDSRRERPSVREGGKG
jgi:hypothetical protein